MTRSFISDEIKYRILLLTLIAFILFSPFTNNFDYSRLIYAFLFLSMIAGVVVNIATRKHAYILLPVFGVLGILFATIIYPSSYTSIIISKLFALSFYSYAIYIFGNNIFNDYHMNIDRIYGAIVVYLLIGIAYATLFILINHISPESLIFQQSGIAVKDPLDFYYFSFITLTTIGYGDIIATHDLIKAFIILEGITGLFYLAILVASLSSILKFVNTKR